MNFTKLLCGALFAALPLLLACFFPWLRARIRSSLVACCALMSRSSCLRSFCLRSICVCLLLFPLFSLTSPPYSVAFSFLCSVRAPFALFSASLVALCLCSLYAALPSFASLPVCPFGRFRRASAHSRLGASSSPS